MTDHDRKAIERAEPMNIASDGKPDNPEENIRPVPCRCGFAWTVEAYPYPHDVCGTSGGEYCVICPRCRVDGPLKARPDWAIAAWNETLAKPSTTPDVAELATSLSHWQGDMPEALKADLVKAADTLASLSAQLAEAKAEKGQ